MRYIETVSFRVFAGTLVLLLVALSLFSGLTVGFYSRQLMDQAVTAAHRVSDTIESSTRYSMLLNRREDVFQIINTIGREPGVEGVRIYNKRGRIMYSSDPGEVGTMADLRAEACYACHEREKPLQALPGRSRARVFAVNGRRVVGVINPIRNDPSCSSADCHAHAPDRTVLGVLDVRMSLARADDAIARAGRRTLMLGALAFLAVAAAAGAFLHFTLRRPIRALLRGTREVTAGHLDHRIGLRSGDDLGRLGASFDHMTTTLRESLEENRRWAATLEERVREKTDELERVDDQLLQIEKMTSLGTLAASVAHEINNPLSGILTYARLQAKRVRREGGEDESTRQLLHDLDLIVAETQRCGTIVQNLLLFSRRPQGEFHEVRLREVLDRSAALIAHHLEISNVRLESSVEPRDLAVHGDDGQLQQAFVALFVNAVEAMPGGGTLGVVIGRDAAGGARIEVADTGVGIPPEVLPRVFEPFFTTKSEGKGVGLGLSVVYGIVERHGGSVSVRSEPGRGTTFTLVLPPPGRRPGTSARGPGAGAPPAGPGPDFPKEQA